MKFFFGLPQLPFMEDMMEAENKFGVDKLMLLLKVLYVIESRPSKFEANLNRLKSYIVQQLQRGFRPGEYSALLETLKTYIDSEPGSDGRVKAIRDIVEMNFMQEPVKQTA